MSGDDAIDFDFLVRRPASTLRHQVTENIRQAIALGRFGPGDRMPERDLCELTGVSRALVREALRQLESEGVIEVAAHRGPVVARITREQAIGVYQVRELLEGLAAQLFAASAADNDIAALEASFADLERAETSRARAEAKNDFYARLIAGAGNEALGKALYMLNARTMLLRNRSLGVPNRWKQSLKELEAIVAALKARDPARARKAAVEHVRKAAAAAMKTFDEELGSDDALR